MSTPNCVSSTQTQISPMTVAETTLGVKNKRARQRRERPALVDEDREDEPEHRDARHDDQRVEKMFMKATRDPLVGEGGAEVVEPDPARRAEDAPSVKPT